MGWFHVRVMVFEVVVMVIMGAMGVSDGGGCRVNEDFQGWRGKGRGVRGEWRDKEK